MYKTKIERIKPKLKQKNEKHGRWEKRGEEPDGNPEKTHEERRGESGAGRSVREGGGSGRGRKRGEAEADREAEDRIATQDRPIWTGTLGGLDRDGRGRISRRAKTVALVGGGGRADLEGGVQRSTSGGRRGLFAWLDPPQT